MSGEVTARRVPGDHPDALAIVAAMVDEVVLTYGSGEPAPDWPSADPAELSPPGGGFVVLMVDGAVVAGGGVKRFGPGVAEIKRMYVEPPARSRGLARRLLSELESLASDLGYPVVRLDTGPLQPHARALYESAGYVAIPAYNVNPYAAFWGEKRLR